MAVRLHDFSPLVKSRVREAAIEATNAISILFMNMVSLKLTEGGASNIGSGGKSSPAGGPPAVDTGELRRSFGVDQKTADPDTKYGISHPVGIGLIRRVGTKLIYAKVQEFGGPDGGYIKAKDKLLLVPIGAFGKKFIRDHGKPKGAIRAQKLTLIRRKGKAPLLVQLLTGNSKRGRVFKGKGMVTAMRPIAVLLDKVRIPARPYMRPVADALPGPAMKAAKRAFHLGLTKRGM